MTSPFKMKGFSGFGNSPVKQKTKTYSTQEDTPKKYKDAEYKRKVKKANAKLIKEFQAKHEAGEITGQELIDAVKEIRRYKDY